MNIKQIKDMALEMKERYGEKWQSALCESGDPAVNAKRYHAVISEENEDLFIKTEDDSLETSWLCDYLEAVSPGYVLDVISRLEKAEAQLVELSESHSQVVEARDMYKGLVLNRPAPPAPVKLPEPFNVFKQAGGVDVAVRAGVSKNHLFGIGYNACLEEVLLLNAIDNTAQQYEALAGWRMVPIKPTEEMVDALEPGPSWSRGEIKGRYANMLEAAPKPEA